MKKNVSIINEYKKEIFKEKTRISGKTNQSPSLLEQSASQWKKKKELKERHTQTEIIKKSENLQVSFREESSKEIINYDKRKEYYPPITDSNEVNWAQYSPFNKQEGEKEKQISLNTATVVSIRKKLIAKEWARALGKKTQNNDTYHLEQEADKWWKNKEEKKKEAERERIRYEQYKKTLNEILLEFSKILREKKVIKNPKELSDLLLKLLEDAGEIFNIEWQEKKCIIWIETWKEKKIRRIVGLNIPAIYKIEINDNLEIFSCEKVENEKALKNLWADVLNRSLGKRLEEISFNLNDKKQTREFLENILCEAGRLIDLAHSGYNWLATIESWENMRQRNLKRKGKPPIITEQIQFSSKDGKLKIALQ